MQAPGGIPVFVDLRDTTGVDSTFLSELLMFRRRHTAPVVALIPKEGNVFKLFLIANVGERMSVFSEWAAACSALGIDEAHQGGGTPAGGTSAGDAAAAD